MSEAILSRASTAKDHPEIQASQIHVATNGDVKGLSTITSQGSDEQACKSLIYVGSLIPFLSIEDFMLIHSL